MAGAPQDDERDERGSTPPDPDEYQSALEDEQGDRDMEAPEADAAEQHRDALGAPESGPRGGEVGLEVDPADAADQDRAVELDEDEYR
ncbi:hypothetical protein BIV57_13735 [Mangrovactinospora gilvigrisea]|uniref:DUF5709 domain-containing protein n=1 Tax=Mangrovactinospora gilvigrisea TaxID=1428644 RepID=A0A1J7C5U8_9ACTN|nr:hypothetical protein [Mangrovactinospora gilvigrisea]OIV36920.1 hypothetical protein BIV57_13735 [Mangrovactinospora gilvigrisea]